MGLLRIEGLICFPNQLWILVHYVSLFRLCQSLSLCLYNIISLSEGFRLYLC